MQHATRARPAGGATERAARRLGAGLRLHDRDIPPRCTARSSPWPRAAPA